MKRDIILVGVGGQGILTVSRMIYGAAKLEGYFAKQTEVHGMSQRGGSVESHLRISSGHIASTLIPRGHCDLILATEPLEALRQTQFLSREGAVVTSRVPLKNMPRYPTEGSVMAHLETVGRAIRGGLIQMDAVALATEVGSPHAHNAVLLGAAAAFTGLSERSLKESMTVILGTKGDKILAANLLAFDRGRSYVARPLASAV